MEQFENIRRFANDYGFIALRSDEDHTKCDDAIDAFRSGQSSAATLREELFSLGVSAAHIRRILAGERIVTASAGVDVELIN